MKLEVKTKMIDPENNRPLNEENPRAAQVYVGFLVIRNPYDDEQLTDDDLGLVTLSSSMAGGIVSASATYIAEDVPLLGINFVAEAQDHRAALSSILVGALGELSRIGVDLDDLRLEAGHIASRDRLSANQKDEPEEDLDITNKRYAESDAEIIFNEVRYEVPELIEQAD